MRQTRFAPSPTGFLHVGGIRTALFSWLTAKQSGGKFFLRLEDTDQDRYVPGSPRQIVESFQWLGLDLDGGPDHAELKRMKVDEDFPGALEDGSYRGIDGPFVQSLRLDMYKQHAEMLVASGHAYRATETAAELESMRKAADEEKRSFVFTEASRLRTNIRPDEPHVIRFKTDRSGDTVIHDLILGDVTFNNANMSSDPVLLKSDGFATYALAAMVDDHLQGVTHVLRSQEWLPSAPFHVQIIQAFGWALPAFAHVPGVNGHDGKKLSKRTGAQSVFDFRDQGYLKEAMLNYLALLGWAPGGDSNQNIFTLDELVQQFRLEQVGKSPAVFEYPKLDWMNEQHIQRLPAAELAERLLPFLERDGLRIDTPARRALLEQLVPLINTRIKKLTEATPFIEFFFRDVPPPTIEMLIGTKMEQHLSLHALREARALAESIAPFEETSMEAAYRALCETLGLKPAQLFSILRNAISGKTVTPPLFGSMAVLGRETVVKRLHAAEKVLGGQSR
jgi:glutamyl-tRNA synthetase